MKNKIMKILTLSLAVGLTTTLIAKPNIDNSGAKERIKQIAGEKGIFVKNEVFPKDYFLISKSLPFAVFLTLHHPRSSELNLSKKQIEMILKIKTNTIPITIKFAKEIKKLELALSKRMVNGAKAKDEYKAVDEIAFKKASLTKAHLGCIESVRNILTPEQRKTLLSYVGVNKKSNQEYSVPVRAVFTSQMMPRYVGIVSIHGYEIGLSDKSSDISSEIREVILSSLKPLMKKVKDSESKVFDLSLKKGTNEQIVVLLKEIAKLKLEASLVQLKCIEMYKEKASKEDFEKVKIFLKTKKKDIFQHVNII